MFIQNRNRIKGTTGTSHGVRYMKNGANDFHKTEKGLKEFIETNYQQGRATGVFSWFHFNPMVKNRNSFIWDHETSSG